MNEIIPSLVRNCEIFPKLRMSLLQSVLRSHNKICGKKIFRDRGKKINDRDFVARRTGECGRPREIRRDRRFGDRGDGPKGC